MDTSQGTNISGSDSLQDDSEHSEHLPRVAATLTSSESKHESSSGKENANPHYGTNISPSKPVKNEYAAAHLTCDDETTYKQGSEVLLEHVKAATRETRVREDLHQMVVKPTQLSVVTSDEIAESEARKHKVISEYNAADAPVWAQKILNLMNEMKRSQDSMQRSQDSMNAKIENMKRCQLNLRASDAVVPFCGELLPLMKERASFGIGLLGSTTSCNDVTVPSVGTCCPDFPSTLGELRCLNMKQLSNLSVWYNDGFGINEEESLEQCIDKFERWICGLYVSD